MQPIILNTILGRVATKSDGSLSLNFSTGELDSMETTVLIKLCRINLRMQLTPVGEAVEPPVEVKSEVASKTPSQRIRAVLFCLYKHRQATYSIKETFEAFYSEEMNRIIESIKADLPEPGSSPPF